MPISAENNSWDYVQRLIEKEINSAFKLKQQPMDSNSNSPDSNVEKVIAQLRERKEKGLKKYGVTTDRKDLSHLQWLQHLQEELMDASVYIEKLKNDIKKEDKK